MASKKKTAKSGKAKQASKPVPRKAAKAGRPAPKKTVRIAKRVKPARPAPKTKSRPVQAITTPKGRPGVAVARTTPPIHHDEPAKTRLKPMGKRDLEFFRKLLLNLRDRIVDEISFLAGENLNHSQREASGDLSNYGMHMADQGTDNFDREFALSLVSNEQEVLYEIDDALHRIDNSTYGVCELTGRAIEPERLKVLPYARYCREAQEQLEKNRKRFRPFVTAPSQGQASSPQEL
jgi:RNA polymerase-binding transcription factor DksA